jgi:PqqD family protein of HPr-rel-A system
VNDSGGTLRWQVRAGVDLRWRSWGDDHIVYHGASGDTHRVNAVTAAALRSLERGPATAEELRNGIEDALGLDPDPALTERLLDLLWELDDLGIVEPIDDPR